MKIKHLALSLATIGLCIGLYKANNPTQLPGPAISDVLRVGPHAWLMENSVSYCQRPIAKTIRTCTMSAGDKLSFARNGWLAERQTAHYTLVYKNVKGGFTSSHSERYEDECKITQLSTQQAVWQCIDTSGIEKVITYVQKTGLLTVRAFTDIPLYTHYISINRHGKIVRSVTDHPAIYTSRRDMVTSITRTVDTSVPNHLFISRYSTLKSTKPWVDRTWEEISAWWQASPDEAPNHDTPPQVKVHLIIDRDTNGYVTHYWDSDTKKTHTVHHALWERPRGNLTAP